MEIDELLTELSQKGVRLWTDDGQLRIRAPKGVLTADLRGLLARHKEDLIELLRDSGVEAVDPSLPRIVPAPEDRYQPFPLNDIQQAYWVGRTGGVELGNVTTHAYVEIEGCGLDPERLSLALRRVIDRHDMLRVIILPNGEQQVLEAVPLYEIEVLDLSSEPPEAVAAGLQAIRDRMSHQVLPLDRWPLFDIRATRIDAQRIRLHFSIDLIITDFGSLLLLVKEWNHFYLDPDRTLPALEISFRDFILTEREIEKTELFSRSQRYWLDRLETLPPRPQLPLATNPATIEKPRFERRRFTLSAAQWQRLKERARQAGLTSSGILLTAFAEVLGRWSQSPRLTVNLTQYNRLPLHPQVNEIIGNSISVVLLAVDNSRDDTFVERARRLQKQLWQDLDHTYMSGIRVLRELARKQGHTQSAIMPVVFTSILGLESLGKSTSSQLGERVYTISQTPQVWLDHQVLEQEGALLTSWDAVEDLFPAGLLDDMFAAYRGLLERLPGSDAVWRERVPVPLPAHQAAVREAANATEAPLPDGMLHTPLAAHARDRGDAPAVISATRTLTYRELFETCNRLGRWLRQAGAVPNQPVAVVMEKGWEQIVAALGILTAGAPYMPIDPELPAQRLKSLLERGEAGIALTQSGVDDRLEWPEGVERLVVDTCDLSSFESGPLAPVQSPGDLAYVLFTSGSTGDPKGVMLDHRGPLNTVTWFNQRFGVGAEDRALALSALNFDLSVYDVFGMLAAGGAQVMPDPAGVKDPASWAELMAEHRVTVWNSVPTLMSMLVEYLAAAPEKVPPGFRLVVMSGDWIPVTLPDKIKTLWQGIRVIGAGGPTETSVWNVFHPIDEEVDPSSSSIPYGRPIANNRYHVLGPRLRHHPDWVPGELVAEGAGLAAGYWRDPETTDAKFVIHPETGQRLYKTGDLGRYLPDGTLEILGRVDFQVKIDGYRIELGEIEAALREHPAVREAVVSAVGPERGSRRLAAYVVPTEPLAPAGAAPGAAAPGDATVDEAGEPPPGGQEPERYTLRSLLSFSRHVSLKPSNLASLLIDPAKRVAFKLDRRGLRRRSPDQTLVELPRRGFDERRAAAYRTRRSARRFLDRLVPLEPFSHFLDCLEQMDLEGAPLPKYRYPSAGSLYPVQTYLHVKAGRVEGLAAGTYYYDPTAHRLLALEPGAEIKTNLHVVTNQEVYRQAAFSIFLIGKLDAIVPIYGQEMAPDFLMLEAGYIGQLLMMSASEHGLGICPIGSLEFDKIRASFHLEDGHLLLHSLVGGLEAATAVERAPADIHTEQGLRQELRRHLGDRLPEYMVPALYVFLDALPLSANNKVDRKALPDPAVATSGEAELVLPRTEIERTLARIVSEVLKVESVGVHSNFFELGGNSVDLVLVYGKLKETLGLDLPIVDLFRRPTISLLAEYLSEGPGDDLAMDRIEEDAEKHRQARRKRRRKRKRPDV